MTNFTEISSVVEELLQQLIVQEDGEGIDMIEDTSNALEEYMHRFLHCLEGWETGTHSDTQIDDSSNASQNHRPTVEHLIEFYIQILETGCQHETIFEATMPLWKNYPKFLKELFPKLTEPTYTRLITLLLQYCEDGFRALLGFEGQWSILQQEMDKMPIDEGKEYEEEENKTDTETIFPQFEQALKLLIFFIQRLSLSLSLGRTVLVKDQWIPSLNRLFSFYGFIAQHSFIEQIYVSSSSLRQTCFQSLLKVLSLTEIRSTSSIVAEDDYDQLNLDVWIVYEVLLTSTSEEETLKMHYLLTGIEQFYQENLQVIISIHSNSNNADSYSNNNSNAANKTPADCYDLQDRKVWENWVIDVLQSFLTSQAIRSSYCRDCCKNIEETLGEVISLWKQFLTYLSPIERRSHLFQKILVWLIQHAAGYHYKLLNSQNVSILYDSALKSLQQVISWEMLAARVFLVHLLDLLQEEDEMRTILSLLLLEVSSVASQKGRVFVVQAGDSYLDPWMLNQQVLTILSLIHLPSSENKQPLPSSLSAETTRSFLRQKIVLSWLREYLQVFVMMTSETPASWTCCPFFSFSKELMEAVLQSLPISSLLAQTDSMSIQGQVMALMEMMKSYFQILQPSSSGGSLKKISSYTAFSYSLHLMMALLSNYYNYDCGHPIEITAATTAASTRRELLAPLIQSFQQNSSLSTFLLQQIVILFQQYQHYFDYHAPPVSQQPLPAPPQHHSGGGGVVVGSVVLLPTSTLRKLGEILVSEKKLFALIRHHSFSNSVKLMLLKAWQILSSSIISLVHQLEGYCHHRKQRKAEKKDSDMIHWIYSLLAEVISLCGDYCEVFLLEQQSQSQSQPLQETHYQMILANLQSLLSVCTLLERRDHHTNEDDNDEMFFCRRILLPVFRLMVSAEEQLLQRQSSSSNTATSLLSRPKKEKMERYIQRMETQRSTTALTASELIVNQQMNLHD